jgi:hypothetical protein
MYRLLTALTLTLLSQVSPAQTVSTFSRCVADSGATMYSAWWCPYCFLQLKRFDPTLVRADMKNSEKMKDFPFMKDCGGEKPGTLTTTCAPKEARGVPMWTFANGTPPDENGKPYSGGTLELEDIAKLTGCTLAKK